jgi:hypothetical protein
MTVPAMERSLHRDQRDVTLERRLRLEALFLDGVFVATLAWTLFGALPFLGILIAALITGQIPVEGQPLPLGYPAFTPPWWAIYPQTALLAILAVGSLPLPLRRRGPGTRATLILTQVFTLATGFFAMAATLYREPQLAPVVYPLLIQLGLLALTVLRVLLGWLRLVPRHWREYVDESGASIPPKEIVPPGRERPWSGRLKLTRKRR